MHWLTKVSIAMLNAHLAMIPRLSAEESTVAVNVSAIGAGMMPKDASQALMQEWRLAASGEPKKEIPKPEIPDMSPEVRQLMGLEASE
jgi:hypothetical protein